MELAAEGSEQIHARHRFALEQNCDVISGHFQAGSFFESDGIRLVLRLLKHGGEAEEFAFHGFIHNHFLVVFVNGSDANLSGDHHVRLPAGISSLVNAFACSEPLEFDLPGQHCSLIIVQESEQWDTSQHLWLTCHGDLLYASLASYGLDPGQTDGK